MQNQETGTMSARGAKARTISRCSQKATSMPDINDILAELPKCGRMRFAPNGNFYRCRTAVISSAIPCPECREHYKNEKDSDD